jgi:hypothetical protein
MKQALLFAISSSIFILTNAAFAQGINQHMLLKNNQIDYLRMFSRELPKTCDVNDVWGGWDLLHGKGKKVRTVRGDYYTCTANCDCGGYFCTTSTGKKFGVATQCEGITF